MELSGTVKCSQHELFSSYPITDVRPLALVVSTLKLRHLFPGKTWKKKAETLPSTLTLMQTEMAFTVMLLFQIGESDLLRRRDTSAEQEMFGGL